MHTRNISALLLISILSAPMASAAVKADFDHDGKSDLVWHNNSTGATMLWLIDGGVRTSTIVLGPHASQSGSLKPIAGDFNGDGNVDLMWQPTIWFMNGTAMQSSATMSFYLNGNGHPADFGGDGKTDVLWTEAVGATNSATIYPMDGATVKNAKGLEVMGLGAWDFEGIADFNNDGKADILWHYPMSGENVIYLMNNTTIAGASFILSLENDPNNRLAAAGDVDGDGKPDLVWYNYLTGDVIVWYMDGLTLKSGARITTVSDLNWRPEASGDFDGDLRTDLMWRNTSTGDVVVWLLNGTGLKNAVYVDRQSDLNWEIAGPK